MPSGHEVHEKVDISEVFLTEETILVLLQFLGHVYDLLIVYQQFTDVAPNLIDSCQVSISR